MSIGIGIGLGLIPTSARPAATTAPVNVVKPSFDGILTQGQSADVNPGSWTGLPSPNFAYAIKRGATVVSTDPDYVWTSADVAAGAGAMTVDVTATNDIGPTTATSNPATIAGPLALSGTPATATVGAEYSFTPSRTGGHGPFTFALGGTLPAGLTFNTSTGAIAGIPVSSGEAELTIGVQDKDGLTALLGPFTLKTTSTPSPVAGSLATDLTGTGVAAAAHYHIPTAMITSASGRMTSIQDRMGLANASEGSAGVGPLDRLDSQGLRVATFRGAEWMSIADTLVWDTRAHTVFMVMRLPWANPNTGATARCFVSQGRNANTPPNTGYGPLGIDTVANRAPFVTANNRLTYQAANHQDMVVGAQIQVIGANSRPTANGGQRVYLNDKTADITQSAVSVTGITGGEIGRYAFSPGSSGNWAMFDLYELIIIKGVLTNAQSDAVAAAIAANWAVVPITDQVLIDGDSLSRGIQVTPANAKSIWGPDSLGQRLTDRGSPFCLPRSTRVVNIAIGGNKMANLVTKRDAANSMYGELLPGKNILAVQIGTNDVNSDGKSAAQVYADMLAYLNTASTGVLQRGWTVVHGLNIARSDNVPSSAILEELRGLYRAPQYLTDTGTGSGGPFAGKLSLMSTPDIDIGGGVKPFQTAADVTANPDMFQGDRLHQSAAAVTFWASGGDTPSNGYHAALTAAAA
jgi:hypothetical protein